MLAVLKQTLLECKKPWRAILHQDEYSSSLHGFASGHNPKKCFVVENRSLITDCFVDLVGYFFFNIACNHYGILFRSGGIWLKSSHSHMEPKFEVGVFRNRQRLFNKERDHFPSCESGNFLLSLLYDKVSL